MISDLSEASAEQLLAAAESSVNARRQLDVDQLRVVLAWADLHSGDPQDEPDAVPVRYGGPRLITLGGDGTPMMADLALLEIAVARGEHGNATRRLIADALDLRHRLPAVWAGVQELRCEVWLARKVAAMSRNLTATQVVIVDQAIAEALDQAPSRVLELAEAKIIEADLQAHTERVAANQRRKGVWISHPKPGANITGEEAGIGGVFARLDEADLLAHEQMVSDLAGALAANAAQPAEGKEPLSVDHWRAEAFAMLADPAAVLAFLKASESVPGSRDGRGATSSTSGAGAAADLVVHLSMNPTTGVFGPVARVEGLGPRLLSQVQALLNKNTHITVTPVVDLNLGRSVNGYEHPTDVKQRAVLRTIGDVFPHASTVFTQHGRAPDHDHTRPFDKDGPPGQTGDHNDTPLTRFHHRAKTHAGYRVFQLGPDRWIWGTPHGLFRLVTSTGTTRITATDFRLLQDQELDGIFDAA